MQENNQIKYDDYIVKFRSLIKDLGLNNTTQREYVLKVLFDNDGHLTAEEIVELAHDNYNVSIGIATVYRVLTFLEEMRIIKSISIDNVCSKKYEINLNKHHDHLICISCGKVIEFCDSTIEQLQEDIAKRNDFRLKDHNMILYGICEDCQ